MGPKRSKRTFTKKKSEKCYEENIEQAQSSQLEQTPAPSTDNVTTPRMTDSSSTSLEVSESASVLVTEPADTESDTSTSTQPSENKKKRAKKGAYSLDIEHEKSMLEFLQENPLLWDIKLTDFRRTDKKNRLWEEQASRLDKTPDFLKGWFRSLRDTFTRTDKRKSGDGAKELTEREQWIKDNFSFLKVVTRHRPEPVFSVSKLSSTFLLLSGMQTHICLSFARQCFLNYAVNSGAQSS